MWDKKKKTESLKGFKPTTFDQHTGWMLVVSLAIY